jgi:hypothetical protein
VKAILRRCIEENVPFCYGANNFEKIELEDKYEFPIAGDLSRKSGDFQLRGFDCSGILHFMSNGILPHCAKGLDMVGKKMFVFNHKRRYSLKEKMAALGIMEDSDYLVFLHKKDRLEYSCAGHVMVAFGGGFVEFKGDVPNVVFTPMERAVERLDSMLKSAVFAGSDVFIIRWHPKLLAKTQKQEDDKISD